MYKVFIDGQAGTTGLRLAERLSDRPDIELLVIDEGLRKDTETRLALIAEADIAFLCLPDEGARKLVEAAKTAKGGPGPSLAGCRVIDCSTAFRTTEGWAYGLPELAGISGKTRNIVSESDMRVANPGCHATGFIMSVRPLVDAGILAAEASLSFHSLTGYSGGGRAMIEEYEEYWEAHGESARAPLQYALAQEHKHMPEILKYAGLGAAPVFSPIVCDYYSGMLVNVPIPTSGLLKSASAGSIRETLAGFYDGCPLVKVREKGYEFTEVAGEGYLTADAFAERDDIEIIVTGSDDRIEIVSRYDNLGKGASGAAIQNMNILLGLPEEAGLVIGA